MSDEIWILGINMTKFGKHADRDVVDLASEANIIQKSGAWYSYNDQRIGQGRENAKLFLRDNPPLMTEIEGKVKELLGMRPAAAAAGADESEE